MKIKLVIVIALVIFSGCNLSEAKDEVKFELFDTNRVEIELVNLTTEEFRAAVKYCNEQRLHIDAFYDDFLQKWEVNCTFPKRRSR